MQIMKKMIWAAALLLSGAVSITCADLVCAEANINQNAAENNLIYNFKNTKKEGTVTFTKKWKDRKNNDDRPIPDIEISTKKPKKKYKWLYSDISWKRNDICRWVCKKRNCF